MSKRYTNRRKITNDDEMYESMFEDRGLKKVRQYATPVFKQLTPRQRRQVRTVDHIWKYGDKYWKLASQYYGNPSYWWIIASFNFAPTESHMYDGRLIKIPASPEEVLRFIS